VTFGGSAAARAAGRGIAREASEQVASTGRRLTQAERARFSARAAAERADAPRAMSVGLTVPFTRNRTVWLGESENFARQAVRIARAITPDRLRDTVARGLASCRGASAVVNDVFLAGMRADLPRGVASLRR